MRQRGRRARCIDRATLAEAGLFSPRSERRRAALVVFERKGARSQRNAATSCLPPHDCFESLPIYCSSSNSSGIPSSTRCHLSVSWCAAPRNSTIRSTTARSSAAPAAAPSGCACRSRAAIASASRVSGCCGPTALCASAASVPSSCSASASRPCSRRSSTSAPL
eukprot:scaffold7917_cov61-Phaeocystis_antarctica.AAC.4